MPVDYSKWDNLDLSDDSDEEEKRRKAAPKKRVDASKPGGAEEVVHKPSAPKDANGAAWNASNYHWEEKQLDTWASQRLGQLFHAANKGVAEIVLENGPTLDLTFNFSVDTMEADAWSHIRKGKAVVGYNVELELSVVGKIRTAAREERIEGKLRADVMVDDEPNVDLSLSAGGTLPFSAQIRKALLGEFNARCSSFVTELEGKAQQQRSATEASVGEKAPTASVGEMAQVAPVVGAFASPQPDVVPATAMDASKQADGAKSHFGGRVQVGGHKAGGLRIS
mmetsp:Transcript_6272/g.15205  ORF Transcript_6272/g.15205 Transcript_6272/m.15205 type:complete len:281 (+) Transcript_6272:103-945(+)